MQFSCGCAMWTQKIWWCGCITDIVQLVCIILSILFSLWMDLISACTVLSREINECLMSTPLPVLTSSLTWNSFSSVTLVWGSRNADKNYLFRHVILASGRRWADAVVSCFYSMGGDLVQSANTFSHQQKHPEQTTPGWVWAIWNCVCLDPVWSQGEPLRRLPHTDLTFNGRRRLALIPSLEPRL